MPEYLFEQIDTHEIHTVFYGMNDVKDYAGPDGKQNGKWKRIWVNPQASFDTKVDPFSQKDFVKATTKKDTFGSIWDRSQDLSEARKSKEGVDNIKEKFYSDWSKKRKGVVHPEKRREKAINHAEKLGIKIKF